MVRVISPLRQGDLDGLCGLYAIINACRVLVPELDEMNSRALFAELSERALQGNPKGRTVAPAVWRGLTMTEITALLNVARRCVRRLTGTRLSLRPLKPRDDSLSAIWSAIQDGLARHSVALAGLDGRDAHWTVVVRASSRRLDLFDSHGRRQLARAACSARISSQRVQLDPSEIVLISTVSTTTRHRSPAGTTAERWRRGAPRTPRVVSVNIAGRVARKQKHNEARKELFAAVVTAVAAEPQWAPLDAVLFPGGFLWSSRAIGVLPSSIRREVLLESFAGQLAKQATRELTASFPGALIVLGIDVAGSVEEAPPEHLVAAFSSSGLAGLAMKAFPAPEDADMGLITHAEDFGCRDRFFTLPNGTTAVLGACYDGFGFAIGHSSRTAITRFVTRLRVGERLVAPTPDTREMLAGEFKARLRERQPAVALIAVHKIRAGRADGYWQRHGIATASAALEGALVIGATHYERMTPNVPHLAAVRVPSSHLDEGFNRRTLRLEPIDRIEIRGGGELVAVAALLSG